MMSIQYLLAKRNMTFLEQLPYSPDFALRDFFLLPKPKGIIKETNFEGMEAIKRVVKTEPSSGMCVCVCVCVCVFSMCV